MRKQLERIDGLIVSLLQLAKMDAGAITLKKGQINLNDLVCVSLQPLEIMLELKKISVNIDVSGSFVGDKEWSREALTNILKNCMEHTKEEVKQIVQEELERIKNDPVLCKLLPDNETV